MDIASALRTWCRKFTQLPMAVELESREETKSLVLARLHVDMVVRAACKALQ